jgi:hypothetical protein
MTDLIEALIKEREEFIIDSNLNKPVEKRIRFKEDQRWQDLNKLSSGIAELMLNLISSAEKDAERDHFALGFAKWLSNNMNNGKSFEQLLAQYKTNK